MKLCSAALKSFDVECTWVTKADPDDFDGRKLPQVTLVGPYEGGVCWCPWSVLGYFLGEKKVRNLVGMGWNTVGCFFFGGWYLMSLGFRFTCCLWF